MSCLDCSCILRTRVESFGAEKNSEDSSSEDSADESAVFWSQSSRREDEQISWSSDVSHYDLQVEIGKGCNNLTSVYLARHIPTGTLVAVRITDLERCSEDHLKALQNEVTLSHAFQHPNIMTLWAVFTAGSWLWVISPFMAYSSAGHLLRTYFPDGMSEALIGNILFGAVSGLSYMHHHGYIHRSIKASHILISGDGLVYLSGLNHLYSLISNGQRLKAVYDFPQFSTSVLPWLSPELLRQDIYGYNVKSDIYSVGITACELANGRVPFQDMPRTQMLLQKLKGPPYCPWSVNTFPRGESRIKNSRSGIDSGIGESMTHTMTSERLQTPPKTFSPAFHNLIELCLQQDPEKRPSARGLLSHAFFKQVKEQNKGSLLSLLSPAIQHTQSQIPVVHAPAAWTRRTSSDTEGGRQENQQVEETSQEIFVRDSFFAGGAGSSSTALPLGLSKAGVSESPVSAWLSEYSAGISLELDREVSDS